MKKAAVIYWSGTGNTEAMANAVAAGINKAGSEVDMYTAGEFSDDKVASYDEIAFGCPSMGVEQLEETEMEPMFTACETKLAGKKVALFGSYGWGDGEWMRNWEDRCAAAGAKLVCGGVICGGEPDADKLAECEELGVKLVK